jgi:hypothetical protein
VLIIKILLKKDFKPFILDTTYFQSSTVQISLPFTSPYWFFNSFCGLHTNNHKRFLFCIIFKEFVFVFQVKTDYVKEQQEEDSQNGQGASMGGAGALGAGRPSRSQQMQ